MNKEVENEKGFIDRDEEAVSRLVGDLKRVEAPQNFERSVMSRIAEGEPESSSFFSLPALALAAGAVIVLLVGSIVIYNTRQNSVGPLPIAEAPIAAPVPQSTALTPQTTVPEPTRQSQSIAQKQPDQLTSGSNSNRQKIPDRKSAVSTNSADFHMSGDFTLRQARPLYPQGFDPKTRRNNPNTSEVVSPDSIPVQDVLMMLGISAEFKSAWIVRSVSKNSSGERSGVKAGDVVEAIGDSQLSADTSYHGGGRFTTITVRRDGQPLTIKLK